MSGSSFQWLSPYLRHVKVVVFFLVVLLSMVSVAEAQIIMRGKVVDSASKNPLASVRIENGERYSGTSSASDGSFMIEGRYGDHIIFSMVGRKNSVYVLTEKTENSEIIIPLAIKPLQLKPVIVRQGMTKYQEDSMHRASLYEDIFNYEQSKSVMSPISTVYQKFSKKHKNIRHFQEQIVSTEQQKFIDTRYTPELVQAMTKLPMDSIPNFMNSFPMEYEYARAATDLEIKMWIKYNYQEFLKAKKIKIPANKPR